MPLNRRACGLILGKKFHCEGGEAPEAVDASSLEAFRARLCGALSSLV